MRRTLVSAALPPLLALSVAACAAPEPTGEELGVVPNAPVTRTAPGGLRLIVRLSDNRPRSGEIFSVSSVIVNDGAAPIRVTSRICGLDVRSDAELAPTGFAMCAGYSMQGMLAPGDSVVGSMPIALNVEQTGTHTLTVRHLLEPDVWVDVGVKVIK
ncbi:MAG TPA: hypothetical protein VKA84_27545 [Gemmatimonadaceae bacterium]|nr:hypothetical protein [Gemmatimonadaceae bacterium]